MTDENDVQKPSLSSSSSTTTTTTTTTTTPTTATTTYVLDTPDGQEHLAKLIKHHRREFLLSDLSQQAAMIRSIRKTLAVEHPQDFAATNLQGRPLDEDAIALGIAKVFYLYTDDEEDDKNDHDDKKGGTLTATSTTTKSGGGTVGAESIGSTSNSAATHPTAINVRNHGVSVHHDHRHRNDRDDAITAFDGEDCQLYECLTNLRQSNTKGTASFRITPSPSHSPNLGPKGHTGNDHKLIPVAKRKTPIKARRPTDKNQSKKASTVEDSEGNRDDDVMGEPSTGTQGGTTTATTITTTDTAAFPTREQLHARAAAVLSETNDSPDIPRGVTVRPSGRWQSQVYYKGQSRYLGVFSDSREAAMAWTVAKHILTEMQVPGASKMEIDKWFVMVREVVTDLVQGAIETVP